MSRGRRRSWAAAVAVYAAAAVVATVPALGSAGEEFLAAGAPAPAGAAAPGDHLQVGYQLWLPGHQVSRGEAPWRDPYSFRSVSGPRYNAAWWPFGLVFWPLRAVFDPVLAWNAFVLLGFVAAGLLAFGWLRELGVGPVAAVAGGLAFALAPYRVVQSADHLLAYVAVLLPAALWAYERGLRGRDRWLVVAAAAVASIPLSGQLHLALATTPFFALYALLRDRSRRAVVTVAGALGASLLAFLLVWATVVRGSTGAGGRSVAQVDRYSAGWADLVAREIRGEREAFVFVGWLTPLLAVAGLVLLVVAGRRALALALGLGAAVPILLSLGTTLPTYEPLWRALPPLHATRVPERVLPVACLALAGLAAFAVDRIRAPALAAVVVALIAVDLRVPGLIEATGAGTGDEYAALRGAPAGRLLEVPVYLPDRNEGSVYLLYLQQAPNERALGYSTTAPREADALARRLRIIACNRWSAASTRELDDAGIRYVRYDAFALELEATPGRDECIPAGIRRDYRLLQRSEWTALFLRRGP
jgi:hypothetical protein